MRWLEERAPFADRCLFATAPDVVGNAFATVNRSYPFLGRIRDMGCPAALVAQDYLEFCIWWSWDDVDCLFIGGSTGWKLSPAAAVLIRVAASTGKWVHAGRVNSCKRYRYAAVVMDADSADGTLLVHDPDKHLPSVLSWAQRLPLDASSLLGADDLVYAPYDGRYQLTSRPPAAAPPLAPAPTLELEQLALI
uniref:hypothetical protein n=1 Tax=Nonomuraea pusilla TaxID=46177 RepID=UPI0006E21619|nr:hypothetical protein [Nonomuraea pusilla]